MTYSKARMHEQRGPGRPRGVHTLLEAYALEADRLCGVLGVDGRLRWPDPKYRGNTPLFAREVLGIEPWGDDEHGQLGLMRLVDFYQRVAVRAGRKVSKSCTLAILALAWFASYYDAQVVMSSTTARQVDEILWDEVRKMHDRASRPLDPEDPALVRNSLLTTRPIDGEPKQLARSGLVSGFRRVAGFTAREGVAAQGKSGVHLLYLLDEASGISQPIIDAIIGNMAASGCKLVLAGNPTKAEGEFYEAFDKKRATESNPRGYHVLTISSEESPNVIERREVVPGLASLEWLQDREHEWGRESPLFKVHVLGQHVEIEAGKIISLQAIREAEERWAATGDGAVPAEGVLHIGVDPAFGGSGDEAAFAVRRGRRCMEIAAFRTLTDEAMHVARLVALLEVHRKPGEIAVVVLDALGDVGAKVALAFHAYQQEHPAEMVLICVRGSDNALRDPAGFVRVRDELWGCVEKWLRRVEDGGEGGAIPEDARLERDLHAPSWLTHDLKQRKVATKKDDLRRALKRSPDRGDALCLACWDSSKQAAIALADAREPEKPRAKPGMGFAEEVVDPYAANDYWMKLGQEGRQ